eukprot:TRINITY_DN17712_c0_g2_i1.p1 TRINITY_DN17712_c0_g2~~TRINITY_DN17712_c0_g2_i1.p1  ORF type:complete len:695 (+),score=18.46 TRINITY_DN17712_c0_g2_i1:384-2468(+)
MSRMSGAGLPLVLAAFSRSAAAVSRCVAGPAEVWRSEWANGTVADFQPMTPSWLGHSSSVHLVTVVGQHGFNQFWREFRDNENVTTGQPDVDFGPVSRLFTTGSSSPDGLSVYIGGAGALSKYLVFSAKHVWDVSGMGRECDGRWRQHIAVGPGVGEKCTGKGGWSGCVVSIGLCSSADNFDTLFVEFADAGDYSAGGAIRHSLSSPIGWWPLSPGGQGHRTSVAFGNDGALFIAAQSEYPSYGWLVRVDAEKNGSWPALDRPAWNVSLAWLASASVPPQIHMEHFVMPNNNSYIALLVNSRVQFHDAETGEQLGATDLDQGVGWWTASAGWSLGVVPNVCAKSAGMQSYEAGIVVAYNREKDAPVQKVFVAVLAVREIKIQTSAGIKIRLQAMNRGLSEIQTDRDMALRSMAVGQLGPGGGPACADGAGVWIASVAECMMPNPCAQGQTAQSRAVVVALNLSSANRCASCDLGYAGAKCEKQCDCYSSQGRLAGYCFDGPYSGGACRCSAHTYHPQCLPCRCPATRGVCSAGVNGSGNCVRCLNEDWFGPLCTNVCKCQPGANCSAGPKGSGHCIAPPPVDDGGGGMPRWQLHIIVVVAVALGSVTAAVAAFLMYSNCAGGRYEHPPRHVQGDSGSDAAKSSKDVCPIDSPPVEPLDSSHPAFAAVGASITDSVCGSLGDRSGGWDHTREARR